MFHRSKFSNDLPAVSFKKETVDGEVFEIAAYRLPSENLWNSEMGLETRGITWDSDGNCVCLPFEKFFNDGERKNIQVDWNSNYMCQPKLDGSMVSALLVKDKIIFKTKKTFYSHVAVLANENRSQVEDLCKYFLSKKITPIFEFTSQFNIIVIEYEKEPKFTLLAARSFEDGKYVEYNEMKKIADQFGVRCIENLGRLSKEEMEIDKQNIEGYVVIFDTMLRLKKKTKWYIKQGFSGNSKHRYTEKNIARLYLEGKTDDMPGEEIRKIEQIVDTQMCSLESETKELVSLILAEPTIKDAIVKYKNSFLFGPAMMIINKKEPNYINIWKSRYLSQFSDSIV